MDGRYEIECFGRRAKSVLRFGKSVTANMMTAYFSRGVDSRSLFEPLKCTKDALFLSSMNQFDTVFVDIQAQFVTAAAIAQMKARSYPASLQSYSGEILLVGITYDKKTKEHQCRIESFLK